MAYLCFVVQLIVQMRAVATVTVIIGVVYAPVMTDGMVDRLTVPIVCYHWFAWCFILNVLCSYQYILFLFPGECPNGVAWTDKAYATDAAHQSVPCSNAGICNVVSGECECFPGFIGSACQRSMRYLFSLSHVCLALFSALFYALCRYLPQRL